MQTVIDSIRIRLSLDHESERGKEDLAIQCWLVKVECVHCSIANEIGNRGNVQTY